MLNYDYAIVLRGKDIITHWCNGLFRDDQLVRILVGDIFYASFLYGGSRVHKKDKNQRG